MAASLLARVLRRSVSAALLLAALHATAQISLTSAVDLALRRSPRVLIALAEVDHARAALAESRDVYIPSVVGGSGLGYSYGFPVGQPAVYNFQAQSLVFNSSQRDYIRAARLGLEAANYALMDARAATAEEAVLAYLALDLDQRRAIALSDQAVHASRLVTIAQQRLDAGQDNAIDLTTARLLDAQVRLARLRSQDGLEYDRAHLARLTGLPEEGLTTVSESVPPCSTWVTPVLAPKLDSPGVLAAYARARSRTEQAFGDRRYEFRPQVSFGAQYNRFASYNNYELYYNHFQHNNAAIGVQITLPLIDLAHRARARESAAEAVRTLREADQQRDQYFDGRLRLSHASRELTVRMEVATLDQQLAQQQLDAMLVQLEAGNGNLSSRQANPKDEQNARIAAVDRTLTLLNTTLELQQTQVNLLRQTGQLEPWLKSLASGPQSAP